MTCDVCGVKFLVDKKDWMSYTGYKGKHYCSPECWKILCAEASTDTKGLKNGVNYGTHFK